MSDFMQSAHIIAKICTKTRKLIGSLYRQFYKFSSSETLLRPILVYAAVVWDARLKKDIDLLKDVQMFGLKIDLSSPPSR